MWNLVSSNRLIDRRQKQEAHRKHLLALNTIKASLDNGSPSQYSFLHSRPKAHQLKMGTCLPNQSARPTSRTTTPSSSRR